MSVCEEFLPKEFCRCFVTQTFTWRIIEAMTDECELINMRAGAFHDGFLALDNSLLSFASRTSNKNPPI